MANLSSTDRRLLDDLLGMGGGWVLDFKDATYSDFFDDYGIDIDHERYQFNGPSKAKRMRAFWKVGTDDEAARVITGLLEYVVATEPSEAGGAVEEKHWDIVERLGGTPPASKAKTAPKEADFLAIDFGEQDLTKLNLAPMIEDAVRQRLDEIVICVNGEAPLAVILLAGSTLEGLLLDVATSNPKDFNCAKSAPTKDGSVKKFADWTLKDLIDAAYELGKIGADVKSFSHALRDFRNYIHPHQQALGGGRPDMYTARISSQVLIAAIADLAGNR